MKYDLDKQAAKTTGGYIESKGAYTGVFTEAWAVTSKNGSQGIHLAFKDVSGATANYLDIYTHGKDGNTIQGFNTINQIMTCLSLRTINPVDDVVQIYDKSAGKSLPERKNVFKELIGKPIGLVLRCEPYMGNNGLVNSIKIVVPFEAKTKKSAREILDGVADASDITHILADLKDKPAPSSEGGFQDYNYNVVNISQPLSHQSENPAFGMSKESIDDDIPF